MNTGPKIQRGNFHYRYRLTCLIPLEEDTTVEEALEWIEFYKIRCHIEISEMPWWAWRRKRYLQDELLCADATAARIEEIGVEAFVRHMVAIAWSNT